MDKIPYFLKVLDNEVQFDAEGELIFYVPESYFTKNICEVIGDSVSLIGIFDYEIKDASGKSKGIKNFYFPSKFVSKPSNIQTVVDTKITPNSQNTEYKILKYSKGDTVIVSVKVPQNIVNVEQFYSLFIGGKLPNTIPYNKLHEYFFENMSINGNKYGITAQLFGIIISESCRSLKDKTVPFRLSGSTDMTAYQTLGLKQIPKTISPFTAITSENFDISLANALTSKTHQYSPLEKLLTL